MPGVEVGAALRASFAFLAPAWRGAWGVLLVAMGLSAAVQVLGLASSGLTATSLVGGLVLVVANAAATGALYRLGLASDHAGDRAFQPGPAGLRWGGLESRVLAANIVVGLVFLVMAIFAVLVWAFVFAIGAGTQGITTRSLPLSAGSDTQLKVFLHILAGPVGLVSLLVAVPLVAGLLLLWAKLSLFALTAADSGRLDFGRAWSLTRGALAALIASTLVILVVQSGAGEAAGRLASRLSGSAGREVGVIAEQLAVGALAPLFAGLALFVYRTQRGQAEQPAPD